MRIGSNNRWIEKISPLNGSIVTTYRLLQSKSCSYSKMKTHYDTLEVSPNATQSEIKSSYYKLSMLYHPDRNKSESAKRKFQSISQAYEVLNNYQTRKRYDRSIMIKEKIQDNTPKTDYTYASVYKSKVDPIGYKYFDFDEWTRQHYGQAFERKRKEKNFTKPPNVRTSNNENSNAMSKMYHTILLVTFYCVLLLITTNSYDQPKEKRKT